jgi:hypothetical protein
MPRLESHLPKTSLPIASRLGKEPYGTRLRRFASECGMNVKMVTQAVRRATRMRDLPDRGNLGTGAQKNRR